MLEQGKSAEDVIAELSPKAQGEQKTEGVSVTQPRGAQSTQGQSYTRQNPATPQSQEDFDALPKGAFYKNPADGLLYTKN